MDIKNSSQAIATMLAVADYVKQHIGEGELHQHLLNDAQYLKEVVRMNNTYGQDKN